MNDTNEKFAKSLYEAVITDGIDTYRDLYENTEATGRISSYWKDALTLYRSLNEKQKSVFMDVIEQTAIDTISSVFGVLDGAGTLPGENFEFDVKINGINTENELQDTFLEVVEENRPGL